MARIFEINDEHRRNLERAMAMLDIARRKRQAAAQKRARANRQRRDKERRKETARSLRAPTQPEGVRRPRLALAGWKMLCVRMDPETWFTFGELRRLMPEYASGSMKAWVMQMGPRRGLFERAGNPDFDDSVPERAMASGRFLYRLTAAAAAEAAQWREDLAGCSDA